MATFPMLSTTDIVQSLHDIGCPITADDVDRPLSTRITQAYLWFWTHTTNITMDDIKMAAQLWFEGMNDDQTGTGTAGSEMEMMQDNVYLGVTWETLNQMMVWALIDDFSVRDLRDPQAPRVRRILSGLINFHLFELEQGPIIDKLEESIERDEGENIAIHTQIEEMKRRIHDKARQLEEEAEQVVKLARENEERRAKLVRLKEMEEPVLARLDRGKRERIHLQEKVENVTMSLKQHDLEISRLRGRVVQSPERVRQTLNDMANSLQSLKDELVEIDRKGREHESRILVAKKYEQDIAATIKLIDEWSAELDRSSKTSSKLFELAEKRDSASEDLRELDLSLQQLSRRTLSTQEQLAKQASVAGAKKDDVRSRMVKLQEKHDAIMAERELKVAEFDLKNKEIRGIEEAIIELTKNTEAEMAQAEAAYKELRNDVLTYSAKLNKALDSLNVTIEKPYEP